MSLSACTHELPNTLVFISHSFKDKDIVDQLVEMLNEYRIDVWVAQPTGEIHDMKKTSFD